MTAVDPEARLAVVKVKRDGARGWHWINLDRFDPRVHELYAEPSPLPAPVTKRGPGRPRKST